MRVHCTPYRTRHCNAAGGAGEITYNGMKCCYSALAPALRTAPATITALLTPPGDEVRGFALVRWEGLPRTLDGISDSVRGTRDSRSLLATAQYEVLCGHRGIVLSYCGTCVRTRREGRMMYRPAQNGTCGMSCVPCTVPRTLYGPLTVRGRVASQEHQLQGIPPRYLVQDVVLCALSPFRDLLFPPRLCGLALMRQTALLLSF